MAKLNNTFKSQLYTYFIKKLGAFDYRKGWLKSDCPFCGKEKKLGINLSLNRTNCFKCGPHGGPSELVMELEGLDTRYELRKLLDSGDYGDYSFNEAKVELVSRENTNLHLPEGFTLLGSGDGQISQSISNYILKRGLNLKELRYSGWGYCDRGDLFGYLIIPFFYEGKLVYYNARRFLGNGPRYKNPNTEDSGVGKSFIIYNKEAIDMYDKVYLCEGAINAATIGEKGVASCGKFLSRYQINEIIKSDTKSVVILLDPDAKMKAIEVALQLSCVKKVKVVFLPDGKDVNDLGRKATMEYVRNTPYHSYSELLKLKSKVQLHENTVNTSA